uniref:Uncharacterized protein n=1 Tax=Sphaerodactylus townsendi TaxID=933632 RepID=A0ACB8E9R4_9SAUR
MIATPCPQVQIAFRCLNKLVVLSWGVPSLFPPPTLCSAAFLNTTKSWFAVPGFGFHHPKPRFNPCWFSKRTHPNLSFHSIHPSQQSGTSSVSAQQGTAFGGRFLA